MADLYFEDYFEEDYFEGSDTLAITPLPDPPSRSDSPENFIAKANAWVAALNQFALELDAVATAMSLNAVTSSSTTSLAIGTGSKSLTVEIGKSYVPGMTVKIAYTTTPTNWMLGTVMSYSPSSGAMVVNVTEVLGSGTYAVWTTSLGFATAGSGSLTQDFSVKSLHHAIGAGIASAATIDLSAATGNFAHITGTTTINAATMTAGKDVWVVFDGALTLGYHATNHRTNGAGSSISVVAGDMAHYSSDGTTVRVVVIRANGKAIIETAAPAGVPVGTIIAFAASSAPSGYLACPTVATNLNRTTYAALFAVIGTTWGSGDGATTFGMPYFPAHYAPVQANGNVGTNWVGDNLTHAHTYSDVNNAGTPSTGGSYVGSIGDVVTKTSSASGASANFAAGARVLFCVKY